MEPGHSFWVEARLSLKDRLSPQRMLRRGTGRNTRTQELGGRQKRWGNGLSFSGSKSLRHKENWIISSGRSWPCGDPVGASQKPQNCSMGLGLGLGCNYKLISAVTSEKKTFQSPLDSKEIKPVNPKGNQPWIFIGRTNAKTPILWPHDEKSWLIGKDPGAGKNWRQKEKGMVEDDMVRWHHQLNGHEFEQTLGHSRRQRNLACCSP